MSYQVLARKWRPRSFQEMVGQEHILRMLTNALDTGRLHHAYLFTGTRGVGKTTLARIFAKCLNCENGISSKPCESCHTCQAINAGKFLDLIEVDAASRTKVEDTRELLDNVQYTPTQGRYKIYLIDETHMLSNHSFNALLKTLEEPPPYVVFLLATTDPKRLPITILSRCLQFNLHHVSREKIAAQLAHISTTENITFEAPALQLLAKAADGSMRDALSLLDQAIAYCQGNITVNETQQMLGSIEQEAIFRLLAALAEKNGKTLLMEIAQLAERGANFQQLLDDVLDVVHQISIAQIVPDACSDERIQQFAQQFSAEDMQLYYQIGLLGQRDLPFAPHPQQGFEMTLLRMLAFHPVTITHPATTVAAQPVNEKKTAPSAPVKIDGQQSWADIVTKLELSGMAQALATNCVASQISAEKIELTLAAKHEPLLNKKLVERIEQALQRYFNSNVKLDIKTATAALQTPAIQQEQKRAERQADATIAIQNDSQVKKIMDIFDATLDVGSIKAIDPAAT